MVTTILRQLANHSRHATSVALQNQSSLHATGRVRIYGQGKVVLPKVPQNLEEVSINTYKKIILSL